MFPDGFARRAWTPVDSRALDYLEGGKGEPVVYLHGAGGPKISPALRDACRGRRLLVPIYPGFEGTEAYDDITDVRTLARLLAVFIQTCADGAATLIAQSLGGHVALWLAAGHASALRSMVLQCPAGFRAGERPQGDPTQLLYSHPERIPKEPQYNSPHAAANQQAAARYRAASFDEDLWALLPGIQCPVLLVHGTADRLLSADVSRRLAERLAQARLALVEDAGHAIEVDQPEAFTALAREHLNTTNNLTERTCT